MKLLDNPVQIERLAQKVYNFSDELALMGERKRVLGIWNDCKFAIRYFRQDRWKVFAFDDGRLTADDLQCRQIECHRLEIVKFENAGPVLSDCV